MRQFVTVSYSSPIPDSVLSAHFITYLVCFPLFCSFAHSFFIWLYTSAHILCCWKQMALTSALVFITLAVAVVCVVEETSHGGEKKQFLFFIPSSSFVRRILSRLFATFTLLHSHSCSLLLSSSDGPKWGSNDKRRAHDVVPTVLWLKNFYSRYI